MLDYTIFWSGTQEGIARQSGVSLAVDKKDVFGSAVKATNE